MQVSQYVEIAREAAQLGREILLNYFGQLSRVSEKAQAGLVSEADVESERAITEFLRKRTPDFSIVGEEETFKRLGADPQIESIRGGRWLIDPLDGTTNYIHKFFAYGVSIGLEIDGDLVAGVVDCPSLQRVYWAGRGEGAFLDGKRLNVSERSELSQTLLATGFSSHHKASLREQIAVFAGLVEKVRGIRRAGSAAFDLCMVAEGIFDGYWEKNLQPWDTAAGALLVREAGGIVSDYNGAKYNPYMNSIVAANARIHSALQGSILKSCQNFPG